MEEIYMKSLQMIKILKIKNKREYNKIKNFYFLLNIDSLKHLTGKRNFKDIIKLENEI